MTEVRFEGKRTAVAPMTVGQLNIAKWIAATPDAPTTLMDQVFTVPEGTTVDDVVECLGVLVSRHEGLRSRYTLGHPGEQHVLASGTIPVDVHEVTSDETAGDGAGRLVALLRERTFDVAAESPVRFALGVSDGQVRYAVAVYSHLVVDFQAIMLLDREFAELVADASARTVGDPPTQPVDRAELERQPGRRRRLDQASRHWIKTLRVAPAHPYVRPRVGPATGSGATGFASPASALALDRIAARTQVSRPTIVLGAFCALLSRRTGYTTCRFPMLSANRFEADLAGYVGSLAQASFVTVEVGDASFDALVRRAFSAVVRSGMSGAYDVYDQHARSERVKAERGIRPSFEPMFNSVVLDTRGLSEVPTVDEVVAALPRTQTRWADLTPTDMLLRFDLGQVDDAMVARFWSGDTGRVDPAETRELLLALERLLVAASVADLDQQAIVEALALPPLPRPPGWQLVDECWVDLAEVRRLLDEALAPTASQVFVEDDKLVAYVAGGPTTPDEAHDRCLSQLIGRHAAMTPHRYVLCGRSPDDVTDLAAWRAQPVLADGTGRAEES